MSGKYGALIQQARKQENQKGGQPEGKKTKKPDDQITKEPESQISGQQEEVQVAPLPEVNLCVKVPKSLRQHWAAEAKRQGVTMTSVIVEALKARFGEP